jgi:hypothetical protein
VRAAGRYPESAYARNPDGTLALNYYGQPVVAAEYFKERHETYQVLPMAGFPPECTCGWTRRRAQRGGPELIDHQLSLNPAT